MAMENSNAAWQKDTRPIEERYAEFKEQLEARFREAHEKKEAFYQIDPKYIFAPVAALPNSKGSRNPFRNENAAILMQATLDKGLDDPRWISANQVKEMGAYIQKGEKATLIVRRNPETKEPAGLVSYFNVSQLSKRDQAKIEAASPGKYRDTIAQNFADYLYKNISFDRDLSEQFTEASAHAYKAAKELDQSWAEKRIAAIDGVNLREKPETLEMRLMQEAKRIRKTDPDVKNYMYKATVAVLKEGKYKDGDIAKALMKVSPTPTGLDFDKTYGQRTVEAAKQDPEIIRAQRLAAAR